MDDYSLIRQKAATIPLPNMGLVKLRGADVLEWLQGQVTHDVRSLAEGHRVSFCFCAPTGQIQCVCDSWLWEDSVWIASPRETVPVILGRVEQMVIMEDVEAEDLSASFDLFCVQGPFADEVVAPSRAIVFASDRTGSGGNDLWLPRGDAELVEELKAAAPLIGAEAYNAARLEAGIPLFGSDISTRTLPPELGKRFEAEHVSYTKGCYVGQEVLHRIFSRGHTNKVWMKLVGDGRMEIGGVVEHPSRPDAGIVTSVATVPEGNIAGAMLRHEAAQVGDAVRVQTERGEVEAWVAEFEPVK